MIPAARSPSSGTISIFAVLVSFVTFIFPFTNILYIPLPINFAGKNFWLVIPTLVIVALYLSSLFTGKRGIALRTSDIVFLIIGIVGGCIFVLREVIYNEQRTYFDIQYIYLPIICFLALRRSAQEEEYSHLVIWTLIVACLSQAVLGILHAHFFPELNIVINPDDAKDVRFVFDAERTREGGTLGASIYANVIVCGMFLLAALQTKQASFRAIFLFSVSMLVMLYAVTLSGSRYPSVVACSLTLAFFSRSLNWRQLTILLAIAICVFVIIANQEGFELLSILRLDEDSGGRVDKLLLPIKLLSEDILYVFIGAPSALVANTFSNEGVGISDNSYMLMALQFGVVFALFWFVFFIVLLQRNVADKYSFFFMLYVLIALGLTNSILWSVWIFFALLTSSIMCRGTRISRAEAPSLGNRGC